MAPVARQVDLERLGPPRPLRQGGGGARGGWRGGGPPGARARARARERRLRLDGVLRPMARLARLGEVAAVTFIHKVLSFCVQNGMGHGFDVGSVIRSSTFTAVFIIPP
jgi:hypothetical protein